MFRPKIGLALGGGGPRGLAHIGIIKVLVDHGIPIDYIAGTSAGALIGGMFAYSKDIRKVENFILEKNKLEMLSYMFDPSLKSGFFGGNKIEQFITEFIGITTFADLHIPFVAVAVDLKTGKKVELKAGSVVKAIHASSAIPMVFKPVEINNQLLVDGAVLSSVPVESAFDMGADVVIAVQLNKQYHPKFDIQKLNLLQVGQLSFHIFERKIAFEEVKNAQIVLQPRIENVGWNALINQEEKVKGIRIGEEEAILHLPHIMYQTNKWSFMYTWNKILRRFKKNISLG